MKKYLLGHWENALYVLFIASFITLALSYFLGWHISSLIQAALFVIVIVGSVFHMYGNT